MDFFGAQDRARRRTWHLTGWFAAAVITLVAMTNALVGVAYAWSIGFSQGMPLDPIGIARQLPTHYWWNISALVVGTIGLASLYKYLMLRGGGRAVAESLNGRLIPPSSPDPAEQRLLNVVAEMAIAAGLPVPPVYVIPEPSINAFAAGIDFGDAVIGVNEGTLQLLDRDELQGVIGHEFSHLLNGDARLNLRLLALLHGILFIGMVGEALLRGTSRRGTRRRGAGSGTVPILLIGVGLVLIGYAGTFFGRLIQAAVCRQREFLADAAAVQFTRQPAGIAGALRKIGGLSLGTRMTSPAAREASHLFFGPVRGGWFDRITGTHPPLGDRIRAIDPDWNGLFTSTQPMFDQQAVPRGSVSPQGANRALASPPDAPVTNLSPVPAHESRPSDMPSDMAVPVSADTAIQAVGRIDDLALREADRLISGLPPALREAAREPWSAQALLYGMVLGDNAARADEVLAQHIIDDQQRALAIRLRPVANELGDAGRLTLMDLALPSLKSMSLQQFRRFAATLVDLMRADGRVEVHEWLLHRLLMRDLRRNFGSPPGWREHPRRLDRQGGAIAELVSALVREELPGPAAEKAVAAGLLAAGISGYQLFQPQPDPGFQRLNRALTALNAVRPLEKPRLIKACVATASAAGMLSERQLALLRGIAIALDCPLPASFQSR